METRHTKKVKASQDGKFHPLNLLRNWLHQALSYMDEGELIFRIFVEIFEIIIIYWWLIEPIFDMPTYLQVAFSFFFVHTINWIVNGNFWALCLFAFPFMKNTGEKAAVRYLSDMASRLKQAKCIGGLIVYGSAARGEWHNKSDLDIRIVRRKGFSNLICANLVVMRERFIAFIRKQPSDLFLADDIDFLKKMRVDEMPIFLIKRMPSLNDNYPGNDEINIVKLTDHRE